MAHRIRHAMTQEPLAGLMKLEGIIEIDETYVGGKLRNPHVAARRENASSTSPNAGRSTKTKTPLLALVQRGGIVRSQRMDRVTREKIRQVLKENVDIKAARIMMKPSSSLKRPTTARRSSVSRTGRSWPSCCATPTWGTPGTAASWEACPQIHEGGDPQRVAT